MNPWSLNKDNNKCKWDIGIFILFLNHRNKRMFGSLAMIEKKNVSFLLFVFTDAFCEMVLFVFLCFNIVFPFLLNVCLSFWSVDFLNDLFTICQCELEIFILVLSDHRVDFICWSKLIMKGLKYFKLFSNYFSKRKYSDFVFIFKYINVQLFHNIEMFNFFFFGILIFKTGSELM